MASSFIDFKGYGFWSRDGFVEAIQLLLFEEIETEYEGKVDWLNEYRKELALQSLPLIFGGMSMCLDETLISDDRIEILLSLIERIKFKIYNDPDYLTRIHLNKLCAEVKRFLNNNVDGYGWTDEEIDKEAQWGFGEDLPTERYLKAFDVLSWLIKGELTSISSSSTDYGIG